MAVKVLVTALGQHIVADAKQVENKETEELIGYWLDRPRLVSYSPTEDNDEKGIAIQYLPYCILSDEQSFTIKADHIVAILEPRDDVATRYKEIVTPDEPLTSMELTDGPGDSSVEDGTDADSSD
jgi:hypothetical protein